MLMYEIIRKKLDNKKFITLFGIIITLLILIAISYKGDEQKIKKTNYIFVEVCTTNFGNLTVHTSLLLFLQFKTAKNTISYNYI